MWRVVVGAIGAFFNRRALIVASIIIVAGVVSADATPAGTRVFQTRHSFDILVSRTEQAAQASGMGVVAQASASRGAAARGVTILGNAIVMVFRNDFAVRMLAASVPAGIEAPIRLYITENPDGTAALTYRTPSAVFAPYANAQLDALALELDAIFERIVADAVRE